MRLKILFPLILSFVLPGCSSPQQQTLSTSVERFEREGSSILKGVKVPAGADMYFSSGIVAKRHQPLQGSGH